ncbi:MAG: hypothetical protein J1G04_00050 [Clostridiales bacterium]|nr:hypothetical protein [Clostridiales bacterium]
MRTSGTTEVLPLGKKQKYACNIVMGALLIGAGVILVLAGVGVIDVAVRKIAAPTVLFAFGISMLVSAIIAKNSLSMWIAGVILSCGTVSLLAVTTTAGYAELYPIYIASPGIGCCFAIFFAEVWFPQVKASVFFGTLSAIFALQSSGTIGWGLTAGLLATFAGVCVILYAVLAYIRKGNNNNA